MTPDRIALLLLASGTSARFKGGDKLLATLNGEPVMARAAKSLTGIHLAGRYAVVGSNQTPRRDRLTALGWSLIDNRDPARGQGKSLALGVTTLATEGKADAVLILLADMPFITDTHLISLAEALTSDTDAVMSQCNCVLCPPAIFSRTIFERLQALDGDQGARHLFQSLARTKTYPLSEHMARDIDHVSDLQAAEEAIHGR